MPTIIELPQVGESVTEDIIGRWLKQAGHRVEKYDPLVEVVTDKVNMEVPSPFTGILTRTLVSEGDTVPMGSPIAEMEVEGGVLQAPTHPVESTPSGQRQDFQFVESVRSVGPTGSGEGGQGRPDVTIPPPGKSIRSVEDSDSPDVSGRVEEPVKGRSGVSAGARQLSPLVRRLVQEYGVDISQVKGIGRGGRITKEDVLAFVEAHKGAVPSTGLTADEEAVPLTPLRRLIADHMARSAREIPVAWMLIEVDATGLVDYRNAHRDAFQRQHNAPLTYLAVVVEAVARALREHPRLNARWGGDAIYVAKRVNIGIAVATEQGLIVPVVHDADTSGASGLALRIHEVVEAARAQQLRLEDVQGGTFTINNTGALGSVVSVPIINHPQAAILTTEAVLKRPVVVDDQVVVRSMMNLCLSFDHRICDGAEAAAFLNAVKVRLESITAGTSLE